jgi:hypothetical protein
MTVFVYLLVTGAPGTQYSEKAYKYDCANESHKNTSENAGGWIWHHRREKRSPDERSNKSDQDVSKNSVATTRHDLAS